MFTIGMDPHKGSRTAAIVDGEEVVIDEVRVSADRHQRDRVLRFASPYVPRTWAIEQASGLGALLAQQLVAAGEIVVDVPPTLSARVRLLDSGSTDKSDPHDARAAAIVAAQGGGAVSPGRAGAVARGSTRMRVGLVPLPP